MAVSHGSRIEITLQDFDLEKSGPNGCYDFVLLLDTDNSELGKFCGKKKDPIKVTSTGNKMTVKFHSDHMIQRKGFKAIWKEKINAMGRMKL